ncbi:MAG: hypothetical protein KC492_05515 [Myxococcales bacterium]|nr:hypothetical protein [Myxococcales bacterium]
MTGNEVQLRRGLLLLALHEQYPYPLTETALQRQVGAFYAAEPKAMARDLHYLADKGYLARVEATIAGRQVRSFQATPQGVDVAEGSVVDPGVEISR